MSTTTREAAAANINDNQQGQDLGFITYWGLSDCRILVDDLRALFQQEGLDEAAYFPPQIQASNAFRKAIKEVIKKYTGHHCLANWYCTDPNAGVMAALRNYFNWFAGICYGPPRRQNGRGWFYRKANNYILSGGNTS